jgi:subtilase family serine protease
MRLRHDQFAALMAAALTLSGVAPAGAQLRAVDPPASYGRYVAPLPASAQLTLDLALTGRNEAEIDGLIAAQNTPGSRYYRHYLTPGQYGRYFGADPAALARAVASLRAQGFTIDRVLANRRDLIVHAPASAVEAAFDTPIDLRTEGTRTFYAARYAPRLRAGLAGADVSGLETYRLMRDHLRENPHIRVGRVDAWGPSDIQSVYDLTPIYATSTGQGITVIDATVGLARVEDFNEFNRRFSLHSQLVTTRVGTKIPFDFNGETTLDVEWISAIAPDVTVDQVSPPSNTDKDFDIMYAYIVNQMSFAHVVTTSWGSCERQMGRHLGIDERLVEQAATEGQWWLAAAGDNGSDDCGTGVRAVDFPGSSPYVVSVGGTDVTPETIAGGRYKGWKSEVTWDVRGDGAGGGGASRVFPKPAFQVQSTPNDGARDVPDVSLMSDDSDTNGGYFVFFRALWRRGWGGTSFAAPEWAGFLALLAQQEGGAIQSPLETLYGLAGTQSYGSLFHDVTKGCNGFRHVTGFCATPGYDQASGLGSFVGANLASAYAGGGSASGR